MATCDPQELLASAACIDCLSPGLKETLKLQLLCEIANGAGDAGITELTGDVTAGPGTGSQAATIAAGAVTLAKMANLAANSVIGNSTGISATPQALSAGSVGLAVLATTTQAAARSAIGAGTGSGSVTDVSVTTANGVSGSVATSTTTPAITLTLGAITPTSAAFTGTGGNGFIKLLTQSSDPAAPASGFTQFADSTGRFSWIRQSDGFKRTWDATLTANRVYTLPDATTTIAGLSVAQTFTADQTLLSAAINGTAGAGFLSIVPQSSTPSTPASGFRLFADSSGKFAWVRPDGFVRTFDASTITASRTWTMPDATTTIAGLGVAQTFSAAQTFSSNATFSANGALSAPAVSFTGTPITGGTATTTKPLVLIETSGATSTAWNTTGTMVGINAPSGFVGDLVQIQLNGSTRVTVSASGSITAAANITSGNNVSVVSTGQLNWSGGRGIITSPGTGQIQLGAADAAVPVAQTLNAQNVVAGTTDTAGVDWTRAGSRGTGTAKSGNIIEKTGNSTTTGSTQHTLSTREFFAAKYVDLTGGSANTLFTVTVGTGNYIGGSVGVTLFATDGTNHQAIRYTIEFSAVNKAGTITLSTPTATAGSVSSTSGTLTGVFTTVDNGSGVLAFKVTPTSTVITPTTYRAKWQIDSLQSNDAATVTAS